MIDFHTHILPGIDDGSRDIGMTEAMLREERRQGVRLVVATPHFYADQMSIDGFLERRAAALDRTLRLREADGTLPEVLAGAEVCYFPGIGGAKTLERLCVEGTRTILVEPPFEPWNEGLLRDLELLVLRRKLNVVLAHIERYPPFQRDWDVFDRVTALPLTAQINAGSFDRRGSLMHRKQRRGFCLKYIQTHEAWIVGSDCHNTTDRRPNLSDALAEIGAEAIGRMYVISRGLLE